MKLAFSQLFFWKSYALRASWCCFHRTGPRYGARTPKRRPETSVGALYCALLPQNRALSCVVGCRGVSCAGHCARGAPKQKPVIIPDGLQIFPGCMCPCIRPECKQDCVCMICHTTILRITQWHKARKLWRVGVGKPASARSAPTSACCRPEWRCSLARARVRLSQRLWARVPQALLRRGARVLSRAGLCREPEGLHHRVHYRPLHVQLVPRLNKSTW